MLKTKTKTLGEQCLTCKWHNNNYCAKGYTSQRAVIGMATKIKCKEWSKWVKRKSS